MLLLGFFSSRRRHTRWNCDWSSDVCSSDLSSSSLETLTNPIETVFVEPLEFFHQIKAWTHLICGLPSRRTGGARGITAWLRKSRAYFEAAFREVKLWTHCSTSCQANFCDHILSFLAVDESFESFECFFLLCSGQRHNLLLPV